MTRATIHLRAEWMGAVALSASRRAFTLGVGFWTIIAVWTYALNAIAGQHYDWGHLGSDAVKVLLQSVIGVVGYGCVRMVEAGRWPVRALAWTLVALAMSWAQSAGGYALWSIGIGEMPSAPWDLQEWAFRTAYRLAPCALWLTLIQSLEHGRAVRERDARLAAAEVAAREAELRALHYQVNPHLLYNALNSLSALVLDRRTAEADRMISLLADFYRANLTADPLTQVPLAEEFAQQGRYLDIEQARFADRLRVEVTCPPDLGDMRVPALILQPLVENAVKHGVHDPGRETFIRVTARKDGPDRLRLEVVDNGPGGSSASGTGIGLQNVRRRLEALYGDEARLRTRQDADGFTAVLLLPAIRGEP